MCWRFFLPGPLAVVVLLLPMAAPEAAATPTTATEAAARLDLETLPLPEGAEMAGRRRVAELGYRVQQPTKDAFDFVDAQLVDRGWQQLPDAQHQGEFASADYQLDGFTVHLSVFPSGSGVPHVMLTHMGNVALEDVPVPANAEKLHAFTTIVMYKSPDGVQETAKACRDRMLAAGWSPYGGAGDTAYYRQHAVQVNVGVMSAPAQGGATVVSISSALLSLELPAPPFADDFRYSDGTTAIGFETDKSPQEVADFYRQQLAPVGWQATTDQPVTIDWKQYTHFRNLGQEMITIATHEFEGQTRVKLDHQNASEVADDLLRERIAAGEKAKYRDRKWLPVEVTIPRGLMAEKLKDWALKIRTPREDCFATAEAIADSLVAAGWTRSGDNHDTGDTNSGDIKASDADHPVIRSIRFEAHDRALYLIALKPVKLEPWVAVVGVGGVTLGAEH